MNIEFNGLGVAKTLSLSVAVAVSAMPTVTYAVEKTASPTISASTQQLNALIEIALANDSRRSTYAAQSQAMRESGIASASQMDPKLKVGFGGLPVDSFKFDQDPMSNISVGLMQQFERGSTLELNKQKANQLADGVDYQIQVREREVANNITQLWLELGYLKRVAALIRHDRSLMVEMEQYVQTNYSIGNSEAQALLNAQLKVSKQGERLQANEQKQAKVVAQLSEWLGTDWLKPEISTQASFELDWQGLDSLLQEHASHSQYYTLLNNHPLARVADANISANRTQVEVAEQAYTPKFGVEVMYAYRQSNNMRGEPASDLLSAYLTMDIPLFTENRQDKNLSAAQHQVGAAQYQKDTLLVQMNAQVLALIADKKNLVERIERYRERLIPQAQDRVKAVERGYQSNTAQYGAVITAASDKLALQIELVRLITDLNQTNSKLASLIGGGEYQVSTPSTQYQEQE